MAAVLAVAGSCLLVFTGFAAWNSWSSYRQTNLTEQTLLPAGIRIEALYTALVDQESGERGYLLTGEESFLEPYTSARAEIPELVKGLQKELAGRPKLLRALDRVVTLNDRWVDTIARPAITARRAGHPVGPRETTREEAEKNFFDRVRIQFAVLGVSVLGQITSAQSAVRDAQETSLALVSAIALVVLLTVFGAWIALRRWIHRPIGKLMEETRKVAGGALDHQVPAQGPPEIAALGRDVESMRRRLRDEIEQVREVRATLHELRPIESELRAALEPSTPPATLSTAGHLLPSAGVIAGDWFDVWEAGPRRAVLAIIDVSGHGADSGVLALRAREALRATVRMGLPPGDALGWVSGQLGDLGERFFSAIVVDVDTSSGTARYANAGHPAGLLVRSRGGRAVETLDPTGPIVGPFAATWATAEAELRPNDQLVLFTDGLYEARADDGSRFGRERVLDIVGAAGRRTSPEELVEALISALRSHTADAPSDDVTVLVARRRDRTDLLARFRGARPPARGQRGGRPSREDASEPASPDETASAPASS